jgi:hypothetical protein
VKKKKFFRTLWIAFLLTGVGGWLDAISWAAPLESLVPKKDLPKGWALIQGPQPYNRKTLFERINGQAEFFFQYGFQGSVFAVYQHKERTQDQIELDIYDMGNAVQAFGILSRFRNEDRPGGFGLDSYLDDHSAFFYKGRYFVLLYTAESSLDALTQFSRLIASKILDPAPPPREIAFFPKDGLKPASIQYFPQGLLGKKFLQRGFRGIYVKGEKESQLFLSVFQDSQKAANALKLFQKDLSKKGKVSSEKVTAFETRAIKGEDPYQGKVIVLQKKLYLLGEVGFEQEEEVVARLKNFLEKIE